VQALKSSAKSFWRNNFATLLMFEVSLQGGAIPIQAHFTTATPFPEKSNTASAGAGGNGGSPL
jgi:hypothetical protein